MSSTHRCPRCTAVLPASAQFCRRCGAAQIETPAPVAAVSRRGPSRRTAPAKYRGARSWIKTFGLFLLTFIFVIALIAFFFDAQPGPTSTSVAPSLTTATPEPVTDQPSPQPVVVYPAPRVQVPVERPVRVVPEYPQHYSDHFENRGHPEHGR